MRRLLVCLITPVLTLTFAQCVLANLGPPPNIRRESPQAQNPLERPVASKAKSASRLVVLRDSRQAVSRITIPKRLLSSNENAGSGASTGAAPRSGEKPRFPSRNRRGETGSAPSPELREGAALDRTRTMIAGTSLAFAVAGGFLLIRRKKVFSATGTAVLLAAALVGLATTAVLADLAPPSRNRPPRRPPSVKAPAGRDPQIIVEVVEDGDAVVLTLGRDFPRR